MCCGRECTVTFLGTTLMHFLCQRRLVMSQWLVLMWSLSSTQQFVLYVEYLFKCFAKLKMCLNGLNKMKTFSNNEVFYHSVRSAFPCRERHRRCVPEAHLIIVMFCHSGKQKYFWQIDVECYLGLSLPPQHNSVSVSLFCLWICLVTPTFSPALLTDRIRFQSIIHHPPSFNRDLPVPRGKLKEPIYGGKNIWIYIPTTKKVALREIFCSIHTGRTKSSKSVEEASHVTVTSVTVATGESATRRLPAPCNSIGSLVLLWSLAIDWTTQTGLQKNATAGPSFGPRVLTSLQTSRPTTPESHSATTGSRWERGRSRLSDTVSPGWTTAVHRPAAPYTQSA